MTDKLTAYLRKRRDSLIIELGGIEEILGIERSITPRRKRVPLRDNETVTHKIDEFVERLPEGMDTIIGEAGARRMIAELGGQVLSETDRNLRYLIPEVLLVSGDYTLRIDEHRHNIKVILAPTENVEP